MNRCDGKGHLVESIAVLPADPTDLHVDGLPIVGCSRIRCGSCNALVRHVDGYAFRTREDVSRQDLGALYDTRDLTTSPLLHQTEPGFRLYLCRCGRWLETSWHALYNPDPDHFTDPDLSWTCDGHPEVDLPHDIDGVRVASPADLKDLATRGFRGFSPPRARSADIERGAWLIRLHARLAAPHKPVLESAALAAVDDPDPSARGRALAFLRAVPSETASAHLVSLLEGDRRAIAGVADPITGFTPDKTLEHSVWRTLAPAIAAGGRARELARADALAGRVCRALYDVLASRDTQWLLDHLDDVARAGRTHGTDLVDSLGQLPFGSPINASRARVKSLLGLT
jgi:hypothetical protein